MDFPRLFDLEADIKDRVPRAQWQPDPAAGAPVTLVTGCGVSKFDADVGVRTETKAWFPNSDAWLCNVALPIALKIAERGGRVIAQCAIDHADQLRSLCATLPYTEHVQVLGANVGDDAWLGQLEGSLVDLASKSPISRLDLALYESYTADAERPFQPTWNEKATNIGTAVARRISFFQSMSNYGFDLVVSRGQQELRLIALTALASYRPAAYLFADAAHKAVSSTFLRSLAREAPAYAEVPMAIVEVCPGMVDTGLYDVASVRRVAWDKCEIGHAPFGGTVALDDLRTWPTISPWDIATIFAWYQSCDWNESPEEMLTPELRSLLSAGRSPEEVKSSVREAVDGSVRNDIPLYAYYPGNPWGSLPVLKPGYSPVFITATGHFH